MLLQAGLVKRIHVNQHNIKFNLKGNGEMRPPFTVKYRGETWVGYEVEVMGKSKVVFLPNTPMACGATAWIETTAAVWMQE
jgi:hypothetical protein